MKNVLVRQYLVFYKFSINNTDRAIFPQQWIVTALVLIDFLNNFVFFLKLQQSYKFIHKTKNIHKISIFFSQLRKTLFDISIWKPFKLPSTVSQRT